MTIFNSIFDAVQQLSPYSPILQLQNDIAYFFRRSNQYELIDLDNGYIGAFPGFPVMLYRGEYKDYGATKASIYRGESSDNLVLDELKIIEFRNILNTFPQVQYAIEDYANVDYLALAQHYGLNTNLVDLTSELEIAAYFATHRWVNGVAVPVEDGIGCIHSMPIPIPEFAQCMNGNMSDSKFHMIGLQCFQRPGIQAAYGIELGKDENLRERCGTVYFKQNAGASELIHRNFHIDKNKVDGIRKGILGESAIISDDAILNKDSWLFPVEDIADVANYVKKADCISMASVEEYGIDRCKGILDRKGIKIVDDPIYELDEKTRRQLANEYKDSPYGDVQLKSRLVYIP